MNPNTGLALISRHTIGIIGAGHLGMRLAVTLIEHGFPPDRILLSHAGSPATRATIRDAGLEDNLTGNEDLCRRSSIIFISVRPQSVATLDRLPFPHDGLVVSCMAGVPRAVLEKRWGIRIVRMMPSGPDTIRQHKGIVAIYPHSDLLAGLLTGMGLQVHALPDEETMHVFTVGVCLPAAILASRVMGLDPENGILEAAREYPLLSTMYAWAKDVLPEFASDQERDAYIAKMSTPGGITEAIVRSIRSGNPVFSAVQAGMARSREISGEAGSGDRAS